MRKKVSKKKKIYRKLKDWIYLKVKTLYHPKRKRTNNFIVIDKIVPTVIIALSGFVLYLDKVFAFIKVRFPIPEKFSEVGMDFQTYIWLLSQTISPLLIILGSVLRPYFIAYAIPIYCYCLQLYLIFFDYKIIDDSYIEEYAIGTSLLVLVLIYVTKKTRESVLYKKITRKKNSKKSSNTYKVSGVQNRYDHIKLLLDSAEELYDNGELTDEMYLSLIDDIEKDFLALKKEIDTEEARRIINEYISRIS